MPADLTRVCDLFARCGDLDPPEIAVLVAHALSEPARIRAAEDRAIAETARKFVAHEAARLAAARQEGCREGVEAAARYHDALADGHKPLATRRPDGRWTNGPAMAEDGHRRHAAVIRAFAENPSLSPTPAESTGMTADGWIEWKGGECPVAPGTLVEVRTRRGDRYTARALEGDWAHSGGMWGPIGEHVVAYRIVQPAEPSAPVAGDE